MTDAWMTYREAVVTLGGDGPVLRALVTGKIKSRGRRATSPDPEDIAASIWGDWSFLPTFKGPLNETMRGLVWIVPPGTELSRVCRGFGELRLFRADVERLAALPAIDPPPLPTIDPPSVDLKVVLTEARAANPHLTGDEAFKIARARGATESREKIRKVLQSLGGHSKPGPKGPRKNRAAPAA